MSEPSEWAREKACGLVACSCGKYARNLPHHGACLTEIIARALDAARAEEREACAKVADAAYTERCFQVSECEASGGAIDSLRGKISEAARIRDAIRNNRAALAPKDAP